MLRAEDVKRFTPVSCSLVSLALSVDTASQNLTSSGNDEWIFPEVFEVHNLPESVWRLDTNSRNFNLITKSE
jgi:hypothetical protein